MTISIHGSSMRYGTGSCGDSECLSLLQRGGLLDFFRAKHQTYDFSALYIPEYTPEQAYTWHPRLKFLKPIVDINDHLAKQVELALKNNYFPLLIGGDHALAIGSISGILSRTESVYLIWIDAHADINTPIRSLSGNIHGMPVALALGFERDAFAPLYDHDRIIRPENLSYLGLRDVDPAERELIERFRIQAHDMQTVRRQGLQRSLESIVTHALASGAEHVHISFDIDVIDPQLIPGVKTPVQGGFDFEEIRTIFRTLLTQLPVRSLDLVECDPGLRAAEQTIAGAWQVLTVIRDFLPRNQLQRKPYLMSQKSS